MTPDSHESFESHEGDELLDRAAVALRDLCIPDGPSLALMHKTRQALRQRGGEADVNRRWLFRPAMLRLAAAVTILGTSAAVYWAAMHHSPAQVSLKAEPSHTSPHKPAPTSAVIPSHAKPPAPSPAEKIEPSVPVPSAPLFADGEISGRVFFDGVPPVRPAVAGVNLMPESQKTHGGAIYDESLVVNSDRTIANVVISVSSGLSGWLREEFPPPAKPAVLDQKGCVFEPHVVAVMVGEPLLIKNSDPFLHNVHVLAVNNPEANLGQPSVGEMAAGPFGSPEVFRVRCDVHPWMSAWVRVVDNPFFAVTGRDGRFSLKGLPPGTYTLKAWHEQLGVREMQVTIEAGRGAGVDFTFKPVQ